MPIYEFRCVKCHRLFEKLFISGSNMQVDIACPDCGSKEAERVMSSTNYSVATGGGGAKARASMTTKSCSPGNSCTSFEIPGPER